MIKCIYIFLDRIYCIVVSTNRSILNAFTEFHQTYNI